MTVALADFDQVLPPGYNTGGFNADGSLRWASQFQPNPVGANPDSMGRYPWTPNYGAARPALPINSLAAMPRFDLQGLFNGGPARASTNPGMVATVKSPVIQGGINTAMTTRTDNAKTEQQSLKDYAAQVLGGQPKAQAAADQEINSINQIYQTGGDSIEARLAQLNRQEQAAANIAAQRAMSGVRRGYNAQRAGGGNSSYLDRLMAQQMYGIRAQNAGMGAQQGRNDLQWLTGQRTGQVGRRQNILDTLAQRGLAPAFAGQQMESGALGNLGRLADLDYGNNLYEMPEDAWRRRLDFLDYLSPYAQPDY